MLEQAREDGDEFGTDIVVNHPSRFIDDIPRDIVHTVDPTPAAPDFEGVHTSRENVGDCDRAERGAANRAAKEAATEATNETNSLRSRPERLPEFSGGASPGESARGSRGGEHCDSGDGSSEYGGASGRERRTGGGWHDFRGRGGQRERRSSGYVQPESSGAASVISMKQRDGGGVLTARDSGEEVDASQEVVTDAPNTANIPPSSVDGALVRRKSGEVEVRGAKGLAWPVQPCFSEALIEPKKYG